MKPVLSGSVTIRYSFVAYHLWDATSYLLQTFLLIMGLIDGQSNIAHCFFFLVRCNILLDESLLTWWRHQMETFPALLVICAGNSLVPGEFPTQRPVTRSFDIFFDLCLNKRLSKQSWGWWFETLSRPLWRQCSDLANTHPARQRRILNMLAPTFMYILRECNANAETWCSNCLIAAGQDDLVSPGWESRAHCVTHGNITGIVILLNYNFNQCTETEMSLWQNFRHRLHSTLSFKKLPVPPVTKNIVNMTRYPFQCGHCNSYWNTG